jgi:hypothetical protein
VAKIEQESAAEVVGVFGARYTPEPREFGAKYAVIPNSQVHCSVYHPVYELQPYQLLPMRG